jgi:hypothetical protein
MRTPVTVIAHGTGCAYAYFQAAEFSDRMMIYVAESAKKVMRKRSISLFRSLNCLFVGAALIESEKKK